MSDLETPEKHTKAPGRGTFTHTLKFKLMLLLFILVIPLIAILYLNNYYSVKLADQQMDEYTTRLLDNFAVQLDTKMSNVSEYLLRICMSDAENLNVADRNDRYFYRRDLHEELQKVIGFYDVVDGIFVYQSVYDEFAHYTKPTLDYGYTDAVGKYLQSHPSDILAADATTWTMVHIDGDDYFVYTLKAGDTYVGAWVGVCEITDQIKALQMGELVSVSFKAASAPPPVLSGGRSTYNVSAHLNAADMDIVAALETVPIYRLLSGFQKIIIGASIVVVVLLLGSALIYKKYIFKPIGEIETAIAQVERGNWDYRIGRSTSTEFNHINENFNVMSSEIRHLKIDVYEEEIHRQQVELEYLHYQIKPHFFLNVINTINSMAQIRETALIQKMTQYLSAYIRYTFRRENAMVTIREELENVKNYLGMQLLRFPDSL